MIRLKLLARHWLIAFLHPRPLVGLFYLPRYFIHWIRYSRMASKQLVSLLDMQPCLGDWTTHTPFDAHYFYQGAWLARKLTKQAPRKHTDIGSSVLTVSVLSAQVDTLFVDFRPIEVELPGLTTMAGNILELPFLDDSIESLSCLHVIEHIGLGRYGDPLDPQGSRKAAVELQRVICSGGKLYLSLPIGRERVCFNAHRVHSPATVLEMFSSMRLVEFSLVDDSGRYSEAIPIQDAIQMEYGCGLFMFEKL